MRADFYHIPNTDPLRFACRVIDKAYQNKNQVYVHCQDAAEAEKLNTLLWTFQQSSFIPHGMVNQFGENPPPIEIGYKEKPPHHSDILINLAGTLLPEFHNAFQRLIEIVPNNPEAKQRAEQHKQQLSYTEIKEHVIN